MALIGAVAFLITFLTLIAGTGEDSVFGYGFLPGILALVIWSIATSIARYRALSDHGPRIRRDRGQLVGRSTRGRSPASAVNSAWHFGSPAQAAGLRSGKGDTPSAIAAEFMRSRDRV